MAAATDAEARTRKACEETPPMRRRRGRTEDTLAVGSRVSAWRVESELGRGGMASVHAVVHTKFGKRAAIKIAHKAVIGDHLSAQTFLREASIVHTIDHPGVIDVFATGSCDGRPYLVMERLAGKTLGQLVDREEPIPRREAIGFVLELCEVLRAAHAAGIVHRDVKLDNVFVCDVPFSDGRRIKLLDWGVARVDGQDDPFRGLIAGTLTYVAPEQIRGDELTAAADVYSLAVLAYHLLCSKAPFTAATDLALIHLHLRAEPPQPSLSWPEIPHAIEDLLVRMLAKLPAERPALDEVERVLEASLPAIDAAPRLADGSKSDIPLLARRGGPRWLRWLSRWLSLRRVAPVHDRPGAPAIAAVDTKDVLGRPVLPTPPFELGWMVLAACTAGLATLLSALP